ncbi:MAG: hypothetical protein K2M31_06390 [Muribaculaceae bacterium]|nr:hypothetical protein [Muribaculaceae bacterium]
MKTILRSLDWNNDNNAGFVTVAYEISQDSKTGEGILKSVNRNDHARNGMTIISPEALPGLLQAYDENQMDQWIYDHAEGMYHGYVK